MRQLPERPDLDQLRRQAKELHRVATAGDLTAARRLRRVSTLLVWERFGYPS